MGDTSSLTVCRSAAAWPGTQEHPQSSDVDWPIDD